MAKPALKTVETAGITVDKGVPLPRPRASQSKYPWDEMAVGDSFFVPHGDPTVIAGCASHQKRRGTGRFTTRSLVENGVAGVRVWRME